MTTAALTPHGTWLPRRCCDPASWQQMLGHKSASGQATHLQSFALVGCAVVYQILLGSVLVSHLHAGRGQLDRGTRTLNALHEGMSDACWAARTALSQSKQCQPHKDKQLKGSKC